jgi:hypothetical protein
MYVIGAHYRWRFRGSLPGTIPGLSQGPSILHSAGVTGGTNWVGIVPQSLDANYYVIREHHQTLNIMQW